MINLFNVNRYEFTPEALKTVKGPMTMRGTWCNYNEAYSAFTKSVEMFFDAIYRIVKNGRFLNGENCPFYSKLHCGLLDKNSHATGLCNNMGEWSLEQVRTNFFCYIHNRVHFAHNFATKEMRDTPESVEGISHLIEFIKERMPLLILSGDGDTWHENLNNLMERRKQLMGGKRSEDILKGCDGCNAEQCLKCENFDHYTAKNILGHEPEYCKDCQHNLCSKCIQGDRFEKLAPLKDAFEPTPPDAPMAPPVGPVNKVDPYEVCVNCNHNDCALCVQADHFGYEPTVEPWKNSSDEEKVPLSEVTGNASAYALGASALEAIDIINGKRQAVYGSPEDSFTTIAAFWSAFLGVPITPFQACAMMVLFKMARVKGRAYSRDNFVDAIGYAAICADRIGGKKNDIKLSPECLSKYGFKDEVGNPLETCQDFIDLIEHLNDLEEGK